MKKLIPIISVVLILAVAAYMLLFKQNSPIAKSVAQEEMVLNLKEFNKVPSCARLPMFLYRAGVTRPIIDLSQEKYTGIAFHTQKGTIHKKEWEKFEYLGTYAINPNGDIYLTPNPFISIKPTTFNLQKGIYKLDSNSGNLTRWMVIDEVKASPTNPYGLISITYDCKDNTLWASAIDKSDYKGSKGRIYHINPKTKDIIEKIENFDALTITILKAKDKRYLLAGNARDNSLYAFVFNNNKISKTPYKLLTLPTPNLHIRKIKVADKNTLLLEAIKFKYSLVAETNKKQRYIFIAKHNPDNNSWSIKEQK